jgi:hypothetical protein
VGSDPNFPWPTWNIDNIKAIPSQNSYDNQLFISGDGGLFILDDTNQVTVRLFGNLVEDDQSPISTQLSSLLSTATKLNSNINNGKIKIEDASGDDISYSTSKGNNQNITQDKNLFSKDSKLIDKNGNEVSEEAAISITKDKNGKDVTITKSDIEVKALDGTTTPLTSIINMKNSMVNATEKFMEGYVHHFKSLFSSAEGQASLINDINAGIQKGEEPEQIARIIATKLAVKQLADQIKNNLILEGADQAIYDQYGLDAIYGNAENQISQEGKDAIKDFATDHPVYSGLYIAAISMAWQHGNLGSDPNFPIR